MLARLRGSIAALFAAVALTTGGTAHALVYDFTSGAQGWTATGAALGGTQIAIGGNPGGYFSMTDTSLGEMVASVSTGGLNLSASLGGTVGFDFNYVFGGAMSNGNAGTLSLFNGATSYSTDLFSNGAINSVALGTWQTFSAALTGATFGTSDANLLSVLSNVTEIRIAVDPRMSGLGQLAETVGIDNVNISAVPEPHEWAMMLAGLGLVGWAAKRRRREPGPMALAAA